MEKISKNYRILNMYQRLCSGKCLNKQEEAKQFGVDERSIQRDIDDIRAFLMEQTDNSGDSRQVVYDRSRKGYVLTGAEQALMSNDEILAVSKILLESRAFTKKEIKEILDSPNFNQEEAVAQQIKLLELQYKHIGELISFAREIQTKGVKIMNFEVFDAKEIEQYKAEVKSKWGNSKAYQEYEQRAVSDSEHNYLKFANEIMSLFTELGAMKQLPPTDKAVQEKVVALQAYINENFYTCSNDILKELGEMYVCDDRFKKNIDCFGGEGTAEFVRDAISIYCDK